MQSVKVRREDLLEKLTANREEHAKEAAEAKENYREAVVKRLSEMLKQAKSGGKLETNVSLPSPQDNTRDYDNAIAMVQMSAEDIIELSAIEFRQYVLDQWAWRDSALLANSLYSGAAASKLAR